VLADSTPSKRRSAQPLLRIQTIQDERQFQRFEQGIRDLLHIYQPILCDDFCGGGLDLLVRNTSTYLPWLWLLTDEQDTVYALGSLSHIIPGRQAYLHGVSHPAIRRNPAIHQLGNQILHIAFNLLGVRKVKAEIEGNNLGAKGFCRHMGFTREAHFRQDNCIGGQWQDVLVYSLFAENFKTDIAAIPSAAPSNLGD
jgi:L-amino acid N-acyltransferase YncA